MERKKKLKTTEVKTKEKVKRKKDEDEENRKENKFKKLISETKKSGVSHVCSWAEVRHGYMPSGRQEALIVPPCGVQVGPGAVGGIITPRSLVQHGDGRDEEEQEMEVAERGKTGWGRRSQRGRKWRSMWEASFLKEQKERRKSVRK